MLVINVSPPALLNFHLSISGTSYRMKYEEGLWFEQVNGLSALTFDLQACPSASCGTGAETAFKYMVLFWGRIFYYIYINIHVHYYSCRFFKTES